MTRYFFQILLALTGLIFLHCGYAGEVVRSAAPGSRNKIDTNIGGDGLFPKGLLFSPLIAAPKQPRFYTSYRLYRMPQGKTHIGAVGYGGTLGVYRWGSTLWDGTLQLDFSAAAFSQFNLDIPAPELINTDYLVGFPLTWRRGHNSARLYLYHQSSHLGPLFFLHNDPSQYALSYEAINFIWSHRWTNYRIYGGGSYLFGTTPKSLKRPEVQLGVEYYGRHILWGMARFVGGVNIQSWAQNEWTPSVSLKWGIRYTGPDLSGRRLSLLLEAFDGHSPHGEFYKYKTSYLGMGIFLGF
ncbi:DUF1207 domain-containing protein [Acidihalobacter prosperus]